MATKKSLVEVTHDDGYGDSLLMHINSAFGGKDMRADKVVDPVASAMQIEGIPDGWELVRFDYAVDGESYMKGDGKFTVHVGARPTQVKRLIIRKIEKPKQYRPFANAAEYMQNWGKPVCYKSSLFSICNVNFAGHLSVYVAFGDTVRRMKYAEAFHMLVFADGTPFGVEVVE